jgi:hypothetical protein
MSSHKRFLFKILYDVGSYAGIVENKARIAKPSTPTPMTSINVWTLGKHKPDVSDASEVFNLRSP